MIELFSHTINIVKLFIVLTPKTSTNLKFKIGLCVRFPPLRLVQRALKGQLAES
jgi:hypothetical protein